MCDCHCLRTHVVVLMWIVVVVSQYDGLIFVVVVRHFFVFGRFRQTKYIRSEIENQINSRQYAVELES